ncbi:MAG: pilus assembly protein PilC [bacterium (Candidatus Stahlbacteria) CG23_combo_of_CG06-09_8_20_14_all_40_9]|nr:MAG: pilus assembly protein PilC [bacterium (Candidatus Stahlbacteria) CG23_combo_of_CG06-09_8_20_14_all_40_9]
MFGEISSKDIATFTRQFGVMLKAGVPAVKCLKGLSEQATNKKFQKMIEEITNDVESGLALHGAFDKKKNVFGTLYVSMVRAGEEGGFLGDTLENIANWLDKSNAIQRKIKGAMAYPAVIFIVAVGVLIFMLAVIIPTFAGMFAGMGAELPGITKVILGLSSFLRNYFWLLILIIIALIFGVKYLKKNENVQFLFDKFTLKLPIFGTLLRKTAISRFTSTMSSLLSSGVPVVDSLTITANTSGNKVIEKVILSSAEKISAGETIVGPLKESGIFPPLVTQLISTGEESGQLPVMLEKISVFYDEEVDTAVDMLTSIIEPVMIVFMGGMVGIMLIAMYLPMFEIVSKVQ